jgi:threonine/homoserine/homoserine lactone efflux protein
MLEYIIIGGTLAFTGAAQPGPLQAFLLSRIAVNGWRRTLPAALAPLLSDGPIALLALTLLNYFAHGLEIILRGVGGVVLLYFAIRTFVEWRRAGSGTVESDQASPGTLLQAVGVNLVNPAPYIGWSLILGPLVIEAWDSSPIEAIALVGSFYVVMILSLVAFILLVGTTSLLGPRGRRGLILVSALALAGLAVYSLYSAVYHGLLAGGLT